METEELLICVNENDEPLGLMNKLEVHQKGILHRAFSVFIFNSNGELLLQKRAFNKYHSPGLWTNTCCSHPRDGETIIEASKRRLNEEMGITTDLKVMFSFIYKAEFKNGLTEHEFDYVLFGYSDQLPTINTNEVDSFIYLSFEKIDTLLKNNSDDFTEWFKICYNEVKQKINKK